MIREDELTPEGLAGHITAILSDPEGAAAMARASLAQGDPTRRNSSPSWSNSWRSRGAKRA